MITGPAWREDIPSVLVLNTVGPGCDLTNRKRTEKKEVKESAIEGRVRRKGRPVRRCPARSTTPIKGRSVDRWTH
jgi:hypothetical protein